MKWFEDNTFLSELSACPRRQAWLEQGAAKRYAELDKKLTPILKDGGKIGPLFFASLSEPDELVCWVYPVDGSKLQGVLIGEANFVKLVDAQGMVYYEGLWGGTSRNHIEASSEFFVWVKPIERKAPAVFRVQ